MKIILDCYLNYSEDSFSKEVALIIKFKIPNKLFRVKRKSLIADTDWQVLDNTFLSHEYKFSKTEEFYDYCIKAISDKEWLKEQAINMFKDYLKDKEKKLNKSKKGNELLQLIKNNSFQIEVDMSDVEEKIK